MRLIVVFYFALFTTNIFGQYYIGSETRIKRFGVSPEFLLSTPSGEYVSDIGFGLSGFLNTIVQEKYLLDVNIGGNFLRYQRENPLNQFTQINGFLSFGSRIKIPELQNASFVLQYKQNMLLSHRPNILDAGSMLIQGENLVGDMNNPFPAGIYAGIDFNSEQKSSLEIGYEYILNNKDAGPFFDGGLHNIRFKYNISFLEKKEKTYADYAFETMRNLAYDTLYFVNKSCPTDFNDDELERLLRRNYTYSAFKVIKAEEMERVQKQKNTLLFALIGTHYASTGDPESVGIFLLDNKLMNVEYPYPYATNPKSIFEGADTDVSKNCIGSTFSAAALIKAFDNRMFQRAGL